MESELCFASWWYKKTDRAVGTQGIAENQI